MRNISILILLALSLYSLEEEDTSYSFILGDVRKDIVNKAYYNLPKRSNTNFLQLVNLMKKEKENYNLNDYELIFLLYYWIGQNFKINCKEDKTEVAVTVFEKGEASYIGISFLFSILVNNLGFLCKTIDGKVKSIEDNISNGEIIEVINHRWNYIIIDNKYYLFDPTLAIGKCVGNPKQFKNEYTDFYFGTKPEKLITSHFPDDKSWQLLETPVTEKEFNSWPYLSKFYYIFGFKSYSPETYKVKRDSNLKISLTYDNTIQLYKNCIKVTFNYGYQDYNYECKLSDGIFSAEISSYEKMDYFIMFASPPEYEARKAIIIYKIE